MVGRTWSEVPAPLQLHLRPGPICLPKATVKQPCSLPHHPIPVPNTLPPFPPFLPSGHRREACAGAAVPADGARLRPRDDQDHQHHAPRSRLRDRGPLRLLVRRRGHRRQAQRRRPPDGGLPPAAGDLRPRPRRAVEHCRELGHAQQRRCLPDVPVCGAVRQGGWCWQPGTGWEEANGLFPALGQEGTKRKDGWSTTVSCKWRAGCVGQAGYAVNSLHHQAHNLLSCPHCRPPLLSLHPSQVALANNETAAEIVDSLDTACESLSLGSGGESCESTRGVLLFRRSFWLCQDRGVCVQSWWCTRGE